MKQQLRTVSTVGVVVLIIGAMASLIPAPYMVERHLEAVNVNSLVKVPGAGAPKSSQPSGIEFPVVDVHRARWIEYFVYNVSGGARLERIREGSSGPDTERGFVDERQLLRDSQQIATYVAMRAADLSAIVEGRGVRVWALGSNRRTKKLKTGDIIVAAGGVKVDTYPDLETAAHDSISEPNKPWPIRLKSGRIITLEAVPKSMKNDPLIAAHAVGVAAVETERPNVVEPDVRWKVPSNINGTSAGLAFALAAYQAILGDFDGDLKIMATGEVTSDGGVYSVGGIEEKARLAKERKVDLLLVPTDNENAARKNADGINIIGIDSVAEAVAAIRRTSR